MGTIVFTIADWRSPATLTMVAAAPANPVAVNTTGVTPGALAVSAFGPAIVPSIQLPTVAMPAAFVS